MKFAVISKEFKEEIGPLFDPCVNAMGWVIVPSDLAPSFGTICAHYCYRVIHHVITYMRAWFKSTWKRQLMLNATSKLLGRLGYEKIRRYNNSPPYVMARWPQMANRFPLNIFLVISHSFSSGINIQGSMGYYCTNYPNFPNLFDKRCTI